MLARLSLREVKGRPGRALLTTASVALGVAALVAVAQATTATRARFLQMRGALADRTPLEVVDSAEQTFDVSVCDEVAKVAGIRRAIPLLQKVTAVYSEQAKARGVLLGIDYDDLRQMRDVKLVSGQGVAEEGEVVLELGFAQSLHVQVGDTIRLLTPQGLRPVTRKVAGLLTFQGPGSIVEVASVFMSLEAAQELWNSEGEISSIRIALDQGAQANDILPKVSALLPEGLEVRQVRARTDVQEETVFLVDQSLNITSTLSIGAALFIVLNTYLMNVSERRRNLGIMRLVGATRGQIRGMLYGEAVFIGAIGTAVGTAVGYFGGRRLAMQMDTLFGVSLPPPAQSMLPLVLGILAGPLMTLAAVAYPAYLAGRTPPLTGMRGGIATARQRPPLRLTVAGLCALALSAALYTASIQGWISAELSVAGTALGMVACVMLLPTILRPAAFVASRLPALVRRTESDLACRQLGRNYIRSTLTAGVVFVVMCAGIGVGNTVVNAVDDIESWQQRTFPADFLLRAKIPQLNADEAKQTSDATERVRGAPGVIGLERMTLLNVTAADVPATLLVREYDKYETLPIDLKEGNPADVQRQVLAGEVLVGTVLSARAGISLGDELPIQAGEVTRHFRVAGIIGEYAAGGLIVTMDRKTAVSFLPRLDTHVLLVTVSPEHEEAARTSLEQIAREEGFVVISYAQFRSQIQTMIAGVVGGLWMLLVLGFLIAAFGIVNTLTMNVLEQTRELGLLRVVGMTKSQVHASIFAQAISLALIGIVPGAAAGILSAWLSNRIFAALFAHVVAFRLQPLLVGACFAGALSLAMVAAFLPARRASRLAPLEAIRIE